MMFLHNLSAFRKSFSLILLANVFFFNSAHLYAQEWGKTKSFFISNHSISFGVGIVPENKTFTSDLFREGTFGDLYFLSHYNFGELTTTNALNVNYTCNIGKRFGIGCFVSYQNDSKSVYENSSANEIGKARINYLSFTPKFTIFWYNDPTFRFYSAAGVSVGKYWSKYRFGNTGFSNKDNEWKPQLTLIGVQAGRKFYGFGEANFGGRLGYLNLGVGYRFGRFKKYIKTSSLND